MVLGAIGDDPTIWKIGRRKEFVAPTSGVLALRPNYGDEDIVALNPQGVVTMRIVVR